MRLRGSSHGRRAEVLLHHKAAGFLALRLSSIVLWELRGIVSLAFRRIDSMENETLDFTWHLARCFS
jgi:hypothetical protein